MNLTSIKYGVYGGLTGLYCPNGCVISRAQTNDTHASTSAVAKD